MTLREVGPFIMAWAGSRPMHLWRRSVVTASVVAVAFLPILLDAPESSLVAQYRQAGFAALKADDGVAADLYFRRLVRLEPTDAEGRFGLALAAEKRGNLPLAHRLMADLAMGKANYPMAHSWLAEAALADLSPGERLREEERWRVQRHLEAALADQVARPRAHALLGSLLLRNGEHHEAIRHLTEAIETEPELRVALAQALSTIGESQKAQAQIQQAADHFREQSMLSPDDASHRLALVRCELLAGRRGTAERLLKQAQIRFPDDNRFDVVLVGMHLTECDTALANGQQDVALQHLNEALTISPGHPGLLERLGTISAESVEHGDAALDSLLDLVSTGKASGAAHLAIGGAYLRRGDFTEALCHFELGLRHNPDSVALLNNLAWSVSRASREPAGQELALELTQSALERCRPGSKARAEVLETRGQILARLERWAEAVVSLERALPNLSDATTAHRTLAQAYDRLGREDLAARHRN